MNLKEAKAYYDELKKRGSHKRPDNLVMASGKAFAINQVIQYLDWNFRVAEELTRERFLEQLAFNNRQSRGSSGMAELHGARLDLDAAEPAEEPPPEHRYFYRLELIRQG